MKNLTCLLLLVVTIGYTIDRSDGYKILGVFPTMAKSHYIVGAALMKGLAEKGHEVTMISPFPLKKPMKNFRDVSTTTIVEVSKKMIPNILDHRDFNVFQNFNQLASMGEMITNVTFQETSLQELLRSGQKFDVVITEVFVNEAMLGIAHQLQAPVIGVSTFGASLWVCEMVGSPSPLSYVPNPFLGLTDRMNIFERLSNLLVTTLERIVYKYHHLPKQEALYEKYFPNPKPKLTDLIRNVSLVLLNTHFSLSTPRPYSVNMIEVGGMHVNRVSKPLPDDLKQFLDSAKDGVIYFSMGSNIKGKNLGKDKVEAILKVFGSLKQKVLWKWEDKTLPGKTPNVMISDWFPQDDILAHPNVKLFITHGGLLSTTESIYHGVPFVAIPVFGDQPLNAARAEKAGIGRALLYDNLNEENLRETIMDVLSKDSYAQTIKKMSAVYRDQPMPPLEKAIYWVEYVARHKGAPHMHSAGQELNFIQYHNVDLMAIIFGIGVLVYCAIKKTICLFTSESKSKSKTAEKDSKKKRQ